MQVPQLNELYIYRQAMDTLESRIFVLSSVLLLPPVFPVSPFTHTLTQPCTQVFTASMFAYTLHVQLSFCTLNHTTGVFLCFSGDFFGVAFVWIGRQH